MQNTAKQNYPGLVAFYDTWPGNEVGLFYMPTQGTVLFTLATLYAATELLSSVVLTAEIKDNWQ